MSSDRQFLADYFRLYRDAMADPDIFDEIIQCRDLFRRVADAGRKLIFVGNGGSAAIASHCSVDFSKQAGLRAVSFNDAAIVTCFANDYGYEDWVVEALKRWGDAGDAAVLISSSGRSANIVNGARYWKEQGNPLVTLSGFAPDNPLRDTGDISFWIGSRAYNIIESMHSIWLLSVCDLLIGAAEYPVSDDGR